MRRAAPAAVAVTRASTQGAPREDPIKPWTLPLRRHRQRTRAVADVECPATRRVEATLPSWRCWLFSRWRDGAGIVFALFELSALSARESRVATLPRSKFF